MTADNAMMTAFAHLAAGRLDEAEAISRAILASQPNHPGALHCLGLVLLRGGRPDAAVAELSRAASLDPRDTALAANLGVALRAAGRIEEAVAAYQAVLRIAPDDGDTLFRLGNALLALGRDREAEQSYRQAIASGTCRDGGAGAYANLGLLLEERGAYDQAAEAHREAIRRRPAFAEYHYNLGNALRGRLALDEAVRAYGDALALKPDYPEARLNQSLALLALGDFARGWEGFEARLHSGEVEDRGFEAPMWDGRPLAGRRLLVHAEQGHGDTIQCLRYLPALAELGGTVVIEVQPALRRLVEINLPHDAKASFAVVGRGDALPEFDFHLPVMSLHRICKAGQPSFAAAVPHIDPEPESAARWRARLRTDGAMTIALTWSGNPQHRYDRFRSIPTGALVPLLAARGGSGRERRFFGLQAGVSTEGVLTFPAGWVTDLSPYLTDFAATAGAISAVDVVITVDTAVAHLAGAMGRPVSLMLPYAADWRWQLGRADSPWYPTMKLYRQPALGDWASVVSRVAADLPD